MMGNLHFMEFMTEGGWAMWPILIFGLVSAGAAVHFLRRPSGDRLACVGGAWLTLLCAVLHGMLTDVAAVLHGLEDSSRFPDPTVVRVLFTGLKEASRPGDLGGIFLTITVLIVTIGLFRGRSGDAGDAAATRK